MKKHITLFVAALILMTAFSSFIMNIDRNAEAITLSTNVKVNDAQYTGQKANIDTVVLDSGRILTVWAEVRDNSRDIYLSYSSNNGTTFSPDMVVNTNTSGDQNRPSIATGGGEIVYVAWQTTPENAIYMSRSDDGGRTFGKEVRISEGNYSIQTSPTIAANGDNVSIVWRDTGSDNSIYIWDGATGNLIQKLEGHSAAVRGISYSPDGKTLVTGSEDTSIRTWNTATWENENTILEHRNYVTDIDWYDDGSGFVSASWDTTLKVWDASDMSLVKNLNETNGIETNNPVNAVDVFGNSRIVAGFNGLEILPSNVIPTGIPNTYFNITVWNTSDWSSFTLSEANNGMYKTVNDVKFSHDGNYILGGSNFANPKANLKVWDASNGTVVNESFILNDVNSVAWSPNDDFIAAGLSNDTILIMNFTNNSEKYWLEGHKGEVKDIAWHKVLDRIASGASDPRAKVWDPSSKTVDRDLAEHFNTVYAVDWSPNGGQIATGGGNSIMRGASESQIYCAVSNDGGSNFSKPVSVAETLEGQKLSSSVGMDFNNTISVAWYDDRSGIEGVYFSNSTDLGASFSDDVPISVTSGRVENRPSLAVEKDTGTVHIVWQNHKQSQGAFSLIYDTANPIYDIFYTNSSDGFTRRFALNHSDQPDIQQEPDIAVTPDGSDIFVTWVDSRLGGYQIFISTSTDGGVTFSGYDVVNDEDTSNKFSPAVGCNKYSDASVVWQDFRDTGSSVYFAGSVLADTTRPYVLGFTPIDGATNISVFNPITIIFSEPMDHASVEDALSVTDGTDTFDASDFNVIWNDYGDEVWFIPTAFKYGSSYNVTFSGSGPMDISNNTLMAGMTWSFSTGKDWDPPVIQPTLVITVAEKELIINPHQFFDVSYDEPTNISAEVKDYNGEIDEVKLFYKGIGDTTHSNTMDMVQASANEDIFTAIIPAQMGLGNVSFYIWASDILGNEGNTTPYTYNVTDMKAPEIALPDITEWAVGSPINLMADVWDFSPISSVQLTFKRQDDIFFTTMNMSIDQTSGNYTATIPKQMNIGVLEYHITAIDSEGNVNTSNSINIEIMDTTKPIIVLQEPVNLPDRSIRISATVTDDVLLADVSLYFKAVGSSLWVKRTMTNESGSDEFTFTIPPQEKSGTIYYYVNATDNAGNTASTLDDIQDVSQEWTVIGTETPWLMYIIPIIILIAVIALAWFVKTSKRPGGWKDGDDEAEEPKENDMSEDTEEPSVTDVNTDMAEEVKEPVIENEDN